MNATRIAEYKTAIYNNEEIEKAAIAGAVAGLFKQFAPKIGAIGSKIKAKVMPTVNAKKAGSKTVNAVKNFAKASTGKKVVTGAKIGTAAGAVKGTASYDASKDDGSFGSSRIGQVAKGIAGGAATGAVAGGAIGLATKGMKPINNMRSPQTPQLPKLPYNKSNAKAPQLQLTASHIDDLYMEKQAIAGAVAAGLLGKYLAKGKIKEAVMPVARKLGKKIKNSKAGKSDLGKNIIDESATTYKRVSNASPRDKTIMRAQIGGAAGAVKGSRDYDYTKDDGSFKSTRAGSIAKGVAGGAAAGAIVGALSRKGITKAPINFAAAAKRAKRAKGAKGMSSLKSLPKAANCIDDLYMGKIANDPRKVYEYIMS